MTIIASSSIRNVAIIAHVDHGKTTLVDALLRQSSTYRQNEAIPERAMDSMDLERERGITIAAKNCAISWEGLHINIVDTPGHSDFGGEVERILSMVDGALLLVDAAEGPLPQTRFVLEKALEAGLEVIVVINKIDRSDARVDIVENEIFSLFIDCGADDRQLECPVLYAIAKNGTASREPEGAQSDMHAVFEAIRDAIPAPRIEAGMPLSILVANLDYSDYVGRVAIGRIRSGEILPGTDVRIVAEKSAVNGRVTKLYGYRGLTRVELEAAGPGQIVAVAGFDEITIGDTITDPASPIVQPRIVVEEPTVVIVIGPNSSPLAGREGSLVTARQIKDRLWKESQRNVSLRITPGDEPDESRVAGRGELQLAILIEQMRREGFEMEVGRPKVIEKDIDGKRAEPYELIVIDIPDEHIGVVTELLSTRKGQMTNMSESLGGRVRMEFRMPSRGLIGIRTHFLTRTRGAGLLHAIFDRYDEWAGAMPGRVNGSLVADRPCSATPYAIANLEDRGTFFVGPGDEVYMGMICGENTRELDIEMYIGRPKKLTNMRASGSDDAVILIPPVRHTLESAMEWINDDELVEVTPKSIRLRKRELDPNRRKALEKREANA